jgi:hypothetical protein
MFVAGAWSHAEEERLMALQAATPGRWAEISRGLGGGAVSSSRVRAPYCDVPPPPPPALRASRVH